MPKQKTDTEMRARWRARAIEIKRRTGMIEIDPSDEEAMADWEWAVAKGLANKAFRVGVHSYWVNEAGVVARDTEEPKPARRKRTKKEDNDGDSTPTDDNQGDGVPGDGAAGGSGDEGAGSAASGGEDDQGTEAGDGGDDSPSIPDEPEA